LEERTAETPGVPVIALSTGNVTTSSEPIPVLQFEFPPAAAVQRWETHQGHLDDGAKSNRDDQSRLKQPAAPVNRPLNNGTRHDLPGAVNEATDADCGEARCWWVALAVSRNSNH